MESTGSPTFRKDRSSNTSSGEEMDRKKPQMCNTGIGSKRENKLGHDGNMPLMASRFPNHHAHAGNHQVTAKVRKRKSRPSVANIDLPKKKLLQAPTGQDKAENSPVDALLARLSESSALLAQQQQALTSADTNVKANDAKGAEDTPKGSIPTAGGSDVCYSNTPGSKGSDESLKYNDASEMIRLKQELEAANSKIAKMDEELCQSRITRHTLDQAMGSASEYDFPLTHKNDTSRFPAVATSFNQGRPASRGNEGWNGHDDTHSDNSDPYPIGPVGLRGGAWVHGGRTSFNTAPLGLLPVPGAGLHPPGNDWGSARPFVTQASGPATNSQTLPGYQSAMRGIPPPPLPLDNTRVNGVFINEQMNFATERRVSQPPSRPTSAMDPRFSNAAYSAPFNSSGISADGHGPTPPLTPLTPMFPYQPNTMYATSGMFQPGSGPPASRLSPTAAEFNLRGGYGRNDPWNAQAPTEGGTTYMSPTEPINYRRLLDRNMSCNWSYIVDKIVRNNDQQASIFLQQKLKGCTADQKYEIIEAIIAQAYPLMINRFGNFLIQRCFEHGSTDQIIAIANAIRGNTLTLSMDPFGCHVVQKAFDSVPEEYKAIMVHELLRRIPETVVHRYACHVWQKLFELRWSDSPPQIMKYVNEALRGMWHEVALGETGSLVVQNIFENCLEEDKRPCINEVLASIDVVAHGQFGNWCIQHICEHGDPADRTRATDHILRFATEYSMDQYASKVIEKCLKIGGTDFLDRYLDRLCEVRSDRPRIPLIDIAGDQFGNYLIQWILQNAPPQHREIVASHVRKHMVSLRGSKYGSRVAMLCCQPQFATRPGVPNGMQINRFNNNTGSGRGNSFGNFR